MTFKYYAKQLRMLNIDEILHYYNVSGSERAVKLYFAFYSNELDYKTENKIIRALITNNKALLENTVNDIQKTARNNIKEYVTNWKKEYYKI